VVYVLAADGAPAEEATVVHTWISAAYLRPAGGRAGPAAASGSELSAAVAGYRPAGDAATV